MRLWQSVNTLYSNILWCAKYWVIVEPINKENSVFPTTEKKEKVQLQCRHLHCSEERCTFVMLCNDHNVNARHTQAVGITVKQWLLKKWFHLQRKVTRQRWNKIRQAFLLPVLFISVLNRSGHFHSQCINTENMKSHFCTRCEKSNTWGLTGKYHDLVVDILIQIKRLDWAHLLTKDAQNTHQMTDKKFQWYNPAWGEYP